MNIVITHINPDFDAISSAYAAYLLYDCDHIAICSNINSNIKKFFEDTDFNIPIKQYGDKEIEALKNIDMLIITDCNHKARIGRLAAFINKAKVIKIYDHHSIDTVDIKAEETIVAKIGSTTTIISRMLEDKGINISPLEATFLSIGLYDDTGSFTFNSTTQEDALALRWLLSQGADTSVINEYIQKELSPLHVMLLNELILNLKKMSIAGVNIAYSFATIDEYVGEAAFITQKLMSIEGVDTLFIMLSTSSIVVLVGRSKDERVDILKVIKEFNGGGHKGAASATIRDMLLGEVVKKFKYSILEAVKPVKTVRELMTTHVKSVEVNDCLKDVLDITLKYNLNHMPVMQDGKVRGIISRKDILRGIKMGFDNEPVCTIMQIEFETVTPDTTFYEAEAIVVYNQQKILPVMDKDKLMGIVTRTDFLRLMHEEIMVSSKYSNLQREELGILKSKNISSLMKDILHKDIISLLKDIGIEAEKMDYKAYVVGGFVRDLIMRIENNYDIDIVIEGDAAKFAVSYAKKYDAKVFTHDKFKTAVVMMKNGLKIDFATSRIEYYLTPAATPEVEESSIKNDLFRRDFTINAMAVRLDGSQYGYLFDFFRGQKDIIDKKIRILHSLSIVDDPSRAFRAIRFAVRFNFSLGSHTERLIKHAESLNLFDRVAGPRFFSELKYILEENGYMKALEIINNYNMLRFYSKTLNYDDHLIERLERAENLLNWHTIQIGTDVEYYKVRFNVMFFSIKGDDYIDFLKRFDLVEKDYDILLKDHKHMEYAISLLKRFKHHKPSFIYGLCSSMSIEALLSLAAVMGVNKQDIVKDYLVTYRHIKLNINGNDILNLGIKKGPLVKEILNQLLKLKLDNNIKTKEDEINYIKENYGV